jgi:hypothetical protein
MFRSWFHKFSNDDLSVETNGFGAYGDLSMQNLFENEQGKLTNQKLRFGFDYSSSDFNEKETTFRPELSSSSDILLNKFSSNVKLNIDYMMGKASTEAKIKVPGVEIKNLPGSIEFEEPNVWLAADDNHFYGSIDFLFSSDVTDKAEIEVFNKPYRTMRNAEVYYQLNPYLKDGEEVNPSKTPLNLGTALNIDNMIPLRFEYAFKFHYDLPVFYPVFDSQTGTITPLWQIGLTDALEQRFTLTTNIAYQDLDISGEFIYSHLRDKDSDELPYYANMIAKIGFGYVYNRLTTNLEVIYDDGRIAQNVDANEYTFENLVVGETYTAGIQAVYPDGQVSEIKTSTFIYSSGVVIEAPINLTADSFTGIISWEMPERALTGFNIYLDDQFVTTLDSEVLAYQFDNLQVGETYSAGVASVYDEGMSEIVEVEFTFDPVDNEVPGYVTEFSGNYPNPFNPTTTIKFSLETQSKVSIVIYNVKGQVVKTLVKDEMNAGNHSVIWNGNDDNQKSVSSGIYFAKFHGDNHQAISKMILMK